jgi:hypothetical protein
MRARSWAAAVVCAGAALGGVSPAAGGTSADDTSRGVLFVQGDSLTVGSKKAIRHNLRGQFRTIKVDAEVGRSTTTGIQRLYGGRKANVWVVALGTNDGPDPKAMRRHVRTVLKRAGDRQVLWVSVWRSPDYKRLNRMLSRVDRKSTQLSVLRWDKVIKHDRGLLASDGVHLTVEGYKVRGRMIADAVRSLLSERIP